MSTPRLFASVACLVVLAACGPGEAPADGPLDQAGRGEAIAERLCAACHAVAETGDSPHADAPAFRDLGARYPVRQLEEALAEGIVVGHPDMPEFQFEANDVDALIVYLERLNGQGG